MAKYEYSVLRLRPSKRRGEVVNVGLAIFLPDRTDIRLLPDVSKIRALDPNYDASFLQDIPSLINKFVSVSSPPPHRLKEIEILGVVEATDLGWFECDEDGYEKNVLDHLSRLVFVPRKTLERKPRVTRLVKELKDNFLKKKILGKEIKDAEKHMVVSGFPIAEEEGLYADFAIRNGVWNFTESLDFRSSVEILRSKAKQEQVALKAITLDKSRKKFENSIPLVVYSVDKGMEDLIERHLQILKDYAKETFNYSDQEERDKFMKKMLAAAGVGQISGSYE